MPLWLSRFSVVFGIITVILLLMALLGGAKFMDLFLGFTVGLVLIKTGWESIKGKSVK